MKEGMPHPIRFDATECTLIDDLRNRTDPAMSVNEILRRAVRFSVPKFISGEAPLTSLKPKPEPATNGR